MKSIKSFLFTFLIVLLITAVSHASWLFYSKPEYNGRIIDEATKAPIQGVVIVALYYTSPLISGPAGGSSSVIHVKEALTNEKGEFHIPSYSTLIQPLSIDNDVELIIYKPGYKSYPLYPVFPLRYIGPSKLFSAKIGSELQVKKGEESMSVAAGVVELLEAKTRDERIRATPSTPGRLTYKDAPLLYKIISEEDKKLGLD